MENKAYIDTNDQYQKPEVKELGTLFDFALGGSTIGNETGYYTAN